MKYKIQDSFTSREGTGEKDPSGWWDSEVCLLLCDGGDGAVTLDLGLTVINGHRPRASPKLAPHFQISAGDCQLL